MPRSRGEGEYDNGICALNLGAKSHLAPGLVHCITQSDHLLDLGYVCRYDEHVPFASESRDLLAYLIQLGFLDIGEHDLQTQSTSFG